ncbi:AraC family transcriptional regulator [Flavobacterium sufflavum]|uniref:AraC family transcriptional regulator n=1 Tax=Flavobacterium sufflavum TaxID=1921138 RepID=A0A437L2S2_9FLAO|nr:helix-turn-helix transcriptional regulator [Flavobacterium sufflavum]RVT79605.1 AraC family transcriptional regulator [Flavobacterium sufflavum]
MFLSVVYFVTGLLGFLTFTVVTTQYKWNRKVNFYLLVLLFACSLRFLFNGVHSLIPFSIDEKIGMVFRSFGCIVFPCIYLYFKNLIADKKSISINQLPHFIFPVLFGFSIFLVREYAPFLLFYFYFLFAGIALFYLFLSYVELRNKVWFKQSEANVIGREELLIRNWSVFFFAVCALTIFRLVITLFFDLWVAAYSDGRTCLWITATASCVLFFKLLLTDETLFNFNGRYDKRKIAGDLELVFGDFWILSNQVLVDNIQDLKLKYIVEKKLLFYVCEIERMALKQFCFRNPSVSLGDFAFSLGIPKSHLIYFFKYHANVSFVEFKRMVQIYDSIDLIDEGYLQSKTLQSLSKKAGFSSYDPFLESFKEVTGVVPQEYEKMMK